MIATKALSQNLYKPLQNKLKTEEVIKVTTNNKKSKAAGDD